MRTYYIFIVAAVMSSSPLFARIATNPGWVWASGPHFVARGSDAAKKYRAFATCEKKTPGVHSEITFTIKDVGSSSNGLFDQGSNYAAWSHKEGEGFDLSSKAAKWYDGTASIGDAPPATFKVAVVEVKLSKAANQGYPNNGTDIFPKICRNAQTAYKTAKYDVSIAPARYPDAQVNGQSYPGALLKASLTKTGPIASNPAALVWDGVTLNVSVDATGTVGSYSVTATEINSGAASNKATGTVFRFTSEPRNAGEPSALDDKGYVVADGNPVMTPKAKIDKIGAILPWPQRKTATSDASRDWRVNTEPANSYSGDIRATLTLNGSQAGYMLCIGVIGIGAEGNSYAVSGASTEWKGKLSVSGGGISTLKSDETWTCTAPNYGLVSILHTNIEKNYTASAQRTFAVKTWLTLKAELEASAEGGGFLQGAGCSAVTTMNPTPTGTSEYLELNAGAGILQFSGFEIPEVQ